MRKPDNMEEKTKKDNRQAFLQLLEKLQQDSWQLELLISGFVIFLLLGARAPLEALQKDAGFLMFSIGQEFLLGFPLFILSTGWLFLIVNLFLHVLLRGLWISTIGLRYVSGEIDYDALGYSPRFISFLQKRIGSFDRYIERLENVCSIIFAFTFLIIFVFISLGLFVLVVGSISRGLSFLVGEEAKWIVRIPNIIMLFFGLIYFIDFLTLGFFKRKKWLSRVYLPIYRVMSFITLSFIYRPMYYNLIDNSFGRWIGFLIVPYIALLLVLSSLSYQTHPFFPESYVEKYTFDNRYYDSLRKEAQIITKPSIPSPYIRDGFLELFIPYRPVEEDSTLSIICPDLEPVKKNQLKSSIIIVERLSAATIAAKNDSSYQCLSKLYSVAIDDSLHRDLSYFLYKHPSFNEPGLKSIIDVGYLPRGKHQAVISRLRFDSESKQDTSSWEKTASIPFWKE